MAISQVELQYSYSGKGPVDAKSLVKTYDALLQPSTWYNNAGKVSAYNGMIVAVWLDQDATKNGVYLLHDPAVTSIFKTPDVAVPAHWHRLASLSELSAFAEKITELESDFSSLASRVSELENAQVVVTYGYRSGFPIVGEENRLYVAADEKKSYVWFNNDYLAVSSDSLDNQYEEPDVINGGSAD